VIAEYAQRARPSPARRDEPAAAPSGPRHDALQRRAAEREAGYGALINARPPGPAPVQLKGKKKHKFRGTKMSLGEFHNMVDEAHMASVRRKDLDDDFQQLEDRRLVSAPGGPGPAMPEPAEDAPAIAEQEGLDYGEMMASASGFLSDEHPVRSVFNSGGPQFIQEFDQDATKVTRRVGIDVEPSAHVQKLGPHLNLQTQHDGTIMDEDGLEDPHEAVSSTASPHIPTPDHGQLALTSEERRKFMERYLLAEGHDIRRPQGNQPAAEEDDEDEDDGNSGFSSLFD
jgi:hypothetical protein